MIVAFTPNPAIDRTVIVADLTIGSIHAGATAFEAAGGKGFNVARGVRSLGGDVLAMGPAGGVAGANLQSLATAEGLPARLTPIAGTTRTCTIITDGAGLSTVVNETGPQMTDDEFQRMIASVNHAASEASLLSISGSWPPNTDTTLLGQLTDASPLDNGNLWIDCAPGWIGPAVATGRSLKINHHEAAGGLGEQAPESGLTAWAAEAAQELVRRGAYQCIVTLGARGAVWAAPSGVFTADSPNVEVVNEVGSGDSFLAGLMVAIERNETPEASLAFGLAAGAANASSAVAGVFEHERVAELANGISVR